ncbi:hypothetical protein GT347_13945 [Xylophilus rhododendri]|uniref:Uncharacterized protein n=1 Tax=Xylophilus rhododendri TaxID=2697032 RepID=A0A857J6X0_9BURK|nr:hypothetical protein [Xylophilus rhododendri]QHI98993.1 hypothetical protein GT347_13945 [Xylophilus rhododendri]
MILLRFFDFSEERSFAAALVEQVVRQLPPETLHRDDKGELSVNKITRTLERIFRDAANFSQKRKMGLMRRSIFANAFKWSLSEKGYPAKFIDLATEGLVVEMAKVVK